MTWTKLIKYPHDAVTIPTHTVPIVALDSIFGCNSMSVGVRITEYDITAQLVCVCSAGSVGV